MPRLDGDGLHRVGATSRIGHDDGPVDAQPARRLLRADPRARRRLPPRRASRPATAATASPARARSTRRSTTAPSCSTPTATASRPSHSTRSASRARSTTCGCARPTSRPRTAFYATIAPVVGLEVRTHSADHVQLVGDGLSFSFVTGDAADRERPHRLHRARQRDRRRLPRGRDRRRLPRQRRPGRAADLPPRLLRRVRARSRRPQHRGRQPQPLSSARPAAISSSLTRWSMPAKTSSVHVRAERLQRRRVSRTRSGGTQPSGSLVPITPASPRRAHPRRHRPRRPDEPAGVEQQPAVAPRMAQRVLRRQARALREAAEHDPRVVAERAISASTTPSAELSHGSLSAERREERLRVPGAVARRGSEERDPRVADPVGEREHVLGSRPRPCSSTQTARASSTDGPRRASG